MAEIAQPATPMMRQYLETKARYPDAILFFRLGDFYEMFFDDAVQASQALQIALTARAKGDEKVPMCGVPYHAARGYVARLLERGFKVAICDQVEEAGKSQLVRREVTRVVTPGMVLDDAMLDPREASFLGAAVFRPEGGGGLALLDASTGQLACGEVPSDERLAEELRRAGVRELLLPRGAAESRRGEALARAVGAPLARCEDAEVARPAEKLRRHLGVATLDGFGVADLRLGLAAAWAALAYLAETQRVPPRHVDRLSRLATDRALLLDESTRANLEVERALSGGRKGSLLGLLDRTVTALGGRRLAEWLRYPLLDLPAIEQRLDAVEAFAGSSVLRESTAEALRPVGDLERLLSRLALGQGNARDLRALSLALGALPRLADLLENAGPARLRESGRAMRGLEPLAEVLSRAVAEEPPAGLDEGGLIRAGHSEELDRLLAVAQDGKGFIAGLESRERQRTGIGSLKVRYNRVFGYYLEVTRPNLHLVPPDYQRRQTTVGGERFITPELKEFEEQVLGAEEKRVALEKQLFEELRQRVVAEAPRLRGAAAGVADADALLSLGRVAAERGYVRPSLEGSEALEVTEGRHTEVEAMMPPDSGGFVPNDLRVAAGEPGGAEPQILVITGPNMAGKSTVLRQAALIALMAQAGGFVPARRARVGLVDRIFTRVRSEERRVGK